MAEDIKAIRNHIIFQFVDQRVKKQQSIGDGNMGHHEFVDQTDWGFEITNKDDTAHQPRWVIITSVGHEAPAELKIGMKVLIDALKWTNSFEVNDALYWRTDSDHVLAIDEDHKAA